MSKALLQKHITPDPATSHQCLQRNGRERSVYVSRARLSPSIIDDDDVLPICWTADSPSLGFGNVSPYLHLASVQALGNWSNKLLKLMRRLP